MEGTTNGRQASKGNSWIKNAGYGSDEQYANRDKISSEIHPETRLQAKNHSTLHFRCLWNCQMVENVARPEVSMVSANQDYQERWWQNLAMLRRRVS